MRNYVGLMAASNKQIVLHDMIEKRYTIRPYGWPDEEVLILVARLLVLGEISLMMDGALVPLDAAYKALTTPANRRKITILKRQTTDPKAIQDARSLGKELFHEMGPDGEDALFAFLQNKLKGWQTSLGGYKPLADTGNYPGKDEIADGLLAIKKLLGCDASYKFIDQFNAQKADLLDLADAFHDLEHFYEHQRATWEKLRKACERFGLNRLELERDAQAGPALKRMHEILAAASPYGLIKEAEGLITTVGTANTALVAAHRQQATREDRRPPRHVDERHRGGQGGRRAPLGLPGAAGGVEGPGPGRGERGPHHAGRGRGPEGVRRRQRQDRGVRPGRRNSRSRDRRRSKVVLKKKRVVEPAKLVLSTYLETKADVDGFLDKLRMELEQAIANEERVEIR